MKTMLDEKNAIETADDKRLDELVKLTINKIRYYNHPVDKAVIKVDRTNSSSEMTKVCNKLVELGVLGNDYRLMGDGFFVGAVLSTPFFTSNNSFESRIVRAS